MVVAKVKQTYSILGNAVNMMISEQGCGVSSCYNTVSAPDIETIAGWMDKYFKYTEKTCVPANGSKKAISWLPEFGYTLDGRETNNPVHSVAYNFGNHLNSNVCFYKLNNGVNLAITRHNTFDPNGGSVLYFVMDANGKQGPNMFSYLQAVQAHIQALVTMLFPANLHCMLGHQLQWQAECAIQPGHT